MRVFISSLNVPIGYTTPQFPSLFWPLGAHLSDFSVLMLYYSRDIWKFHVVWFLIMFVGFYTVAGGTAFITYCIGGHRQKVPPSSYLFKGIWIFCGYILLACLIAFIGGSVVGLLTSAIYKAGSMTMTTWIPFTWALVGILYDVCSSYLTSQITL